MRKIPTSAVLQVWRSEDMLFWYRVDVVVIFHRYFGVFADEGAEHPLFDYPQHNLIDIFFLHDVLGLFGLDLVDLLVFFILVEGNAMDVREVNFASPLPGANEVH